MRRALPDVCKSGQTALEKKLLLYYDARQHYGFELRYPDSTLYDESDLPPLEHITEFIPLWEIGRRVFMFKTKTDKEKARDHLNGVDKSSKRKRRKTTRGPKPKKSGGRNRRSKK